MDDQRRRGMTSPSFSYNYPHLANTGALNPQVFEAFLDPVKVKLNKKGKAVKLSSVKKLESDFPPMMSNNNMKDVELAKARLGFFLSKQAGMQTDEQMKLKSNMEVLRGATTLLGIKKNTRFSDRERAQMFNNAIKQGFRFP